MSGNLVLLGGALLSGFMGSAHCALMCGGIATGLNARGGGSWIAALESNLGRVLGYGLAGAIAGGLGHGIVSVLNMPALGLAARAGAGLVLLMAAVRIFDRRGRLSFLRAPGIVWQRWLAPLHGRLPSGGAAARVVSGMLWGWLPCGLSATVLLAAWLQSSALAGATLMLCFGLGTLPAMVPLTWSGARLCQRFQHGAARMALASLVLIAGLVTMSAPWLAGIPHVQGALKALGCHSMG